MSNVIVSKENICICNKNAKLRCSICKTQYYCSKTCQATDWPLHKKQCMRFNQPSDTFDRQKQQLQTELEQQKLELEEQKRQVEEQQRLIAEQKKELEELRRTYGISDRVRSDPDGAGRFARNTNIGSTIEERVGTMIDYTKSHFTSNWKDNIQLLLRRLNDKEDGNGDFICFHFASKSVNDPLFDHLYTVPRYLTTVFIGLRQHPGTVYFIISSHTDGIFYKTKKHNKGKYICTRENILCSTDNLEPNAIFECDISHLNDVPYYFTDWYTGTIMGNGTLEEFDKKVSED